MAQLSISNVINISVAEAGAGVGEYNTSNVALMTQEVPAESFGDDGFKIYREPTEVGTDFGTDSASYKMALQIFSQSPNILANRGYLVVVLMEAEVQSLDFSAVPASGVFKINYGALPTAAINFDDTVAEIQAALRLVAGLESVVVTGTSIAANDIEVELKGVYGNVALLTISDNTLETAGEVAVDVDVAQVTAGETFAGAITRSKSMVQYFVAMCTVILNEADTLAAAAVIQALIKLAVVCQKDADEVETGGILDKLRSQSYKKTRGWFYGSADDIDCLESMAAYVGRMFCVDFSGENTTNNAHMKSLTGVDADDSMTETLLAKCQAAGADCYVSIEGVAKVFASGANDFLDQVYNLYAFVGSLQVAEFNLIAQTATKIPQTEGGVDLFKGVDRKVCDQFVTNGYLAPGTWNSPVTFGDQAKFLNNIKQFGFYIYSLAVSSQSSAARAARQAPLRQIAIKEAGGINSATAIINVNK